MTINWPVFAIAIISGYVALPAYTQHRTLSFTYAVIIAQALFGFVLALYAPTHSTVIVCFAVASPHAATLVSFLVSRAIDVMRVKSEVQRVLSG